MGKVIKFNALKTNAADIKPVLTPSRKKGELVFQSMVEDLCIVMRARRCKDSAVNKARAHIRELKEYSNKFPWEWTREDFERFCSYLYKEKHNSVGTQRQKQKNIKRFTEYLISSKYFYTIREQFGVTLKPICLPDNMIVHKIEYDNKTKKKAFTSLELQKFFDCMDDYIRNCYETRDKALKSAMRDKALFAVMALYGLRITEIRMLDITDIHPNPYVPEFGRIGYIHVRFGKSSSGSQFKERMVYTLDLQGKEMIEWYLTEVRHFFIRGNTDDIRAMFYSERGNRISVRAMERNFKMYLYAFDMHTDGLTPHCMRHTYSTLSQENSLISSHLIRRQLGHEYLSTTQHYTHMSDTFIKKSIQAVVDKNLAERLASIRERNQKDDKR